MSFFPKCTTVMTLDLHQTFVYPQYLGNKLTEFHQILYMHSFSSSEHKSLIVLRPLLCFVHRQQFALSDNCPYRRVAEFHIRLTF